MSYSHMCLCLQFRQVEKRVFSWFQENKIRWNTKRLIKHTNQLKREWKIHRIKRKRKIKKKHTHKRETTNKTNNNNCTQEKQYQNNKSIASSHPDAFSFTLNLCLLSLYSVWQIVRLQPFQSFEIISQLWFQCWIEQNEKFSVRLSKLFCVVCDG